MEKEIHKHGENGCFFSVFLLFVLSSHFPFYLKYTFLQSSIVDDKGIHYLHLKSLIEKRLRPYDQCYQNTYIFFNRSVSTALGERQTLYF